MTKSRQTYPTDLNCSELELLAQFFPVSSRGRPRKWELWVIVNAIVYVNRTGCQWRMLPLNFPPWQTVYGYFWRWTRSGLWATLNAELVKRARQRTGRDPQPNAGSIASQSVKTSEGGEARGVDVFKQTNGRKRHIVVDTLGLLLVVLVHSASIPDGSGGKLVNEVTSWVRETLFHPGRRLPVLALSPAEDTDRPVLDAQAAAERLAGLAVVVVLDPLG